MNVGINDAGNQLGPVNKTAPSISFKDSFISPTVCHLIIGINLNASLKNLA